MMNIEVDQYRYSQQDEKDNWLLNKRVYRSVLYKRQVIFQKKMISHSFLLANNNQTVIETLWMKLFDWVLLLFLIFDEAYTTGIRPVR